MQSWRHVVPCMDHDAQAALPSISPRICSLPSQPFGQPFGPCGGSRRTRCSGGGRGARTTSCWVPAVHGSGEPQSIIICRHVRTPEPQTLPACRRWVYAPADGGGRQLQQTPRALQEPQRPASMFIECLNALASSPPSPGDTRSRERSSGRQQRRPSRSSVQAGGPCAPGQPEGSQQQPGRACCRCDRSPTRYSRNGMPAYDDGGQCACWPQRRQWGHESVCTDPPAAVPPCRG